MRTEPGCFTQSLRPCAGCLWVGMAWGSSQAGVTRLRFTSNAWVRVAFLSTTPYRLLLGAAPQSTHPHPSPCWLWCLSTSQVTVHSDAQSSFLNFMQLLGKLLWECLREKLRASQWMTSPALRDTCSCGVSWALPALREPTTLGK